MDSDEQLSGVAATALLTAYARAQESTRDDRLFTDTWARIFVTQATGSAGEGLPRMGIARDDGSSPLWEAFGSYFVIRTPFFDSGVTAACARGIRQVVLLAAGLDSRAYRLDLPDGVTFFEVDQPEVLDFKNAVLTARGARPRAGRVSVAADLRSDWVKGLTDAGLNPAEPTLWTAEGLLTYFAEADCDRLMAAITEASAPGSGLLVDYAARPAGRNAVTGPAVDDAELEMATNIAELGRPGPGEDPWTWLCRYGWEASVTTAVDEYARLGRKLPALATEAAEDVPAWLVGGTLPVSEI